MAVTADKLSTTSCKSPLFLNGYTIGVIGPVITLLTREYHGNELGTQYYSELLTKCPKGLYSVCSFVDGFNSIQAGIFSKIYIIAATAGKVGAFI